jgi:hypothetical protein
MAKRRKAAKRSSSRKTTRRQPRKSWTSQALGMLRKLAPTSTAKQIARELGRSVAAIRQIARRKRIKIMSSRRGGRRKR